MFLSKPGIDIVDARTLGILRSLNNVSSPMTGRQIAKVTNSAKSKTNTVLNTLVELGVLTSVKTGNAFNYTPNKKHFYWQIFDQIESFDSQLRSKLIEILPPDLRASDKNAALFLFGSVARKQATLTSDIDLGIIVPDRKSLNETQKRIDFYRPEIEAFTGNELNPFLVPWREFVRMVSNENSLVKSWENEAEYLAGDYVDDLKTKVLGDPNTYQASADLYV